MTETREAVARALHDSYCGCPDVSDQCSGEADLAIAAYESNPPEWLRWLLDVAAAAAPHTTRELVPEHVRKAVRL